MLTWNEWPECDDIHNFNTDTIFQLIHLDNPYKLQKLLENSEKLLSYTQSIIKALRLVLNNQKAQYIQPLQLTMPFKSDDYKNIQKIPKTPSLLTFHTSPFIHTPIEWLTIQSTQGHVVYFEWNTKLFDQFKIQTEYDTIIHITCKIPYSMQRTSGVNIYTFKDKVNAFEPHLTKHMIECTIKSNQKPIKYSFLKNSSNEYDAEPDALNSLETIENHLQSSIHQCKTCIEQYQKKFQNIILNHSVS